jgi:preprotein translocase subunit SecG
MNSDANLQNNNQENNQYTPGGYDRANLKKLLLIVVGVFFAITIIVLVFAFQSKPESQQSKYLKSATIAARNNTPNAKVTNIKVAGGFALALVSDPTSQGQSNAGNTIIFKVNKDGSMVQIAEGSSFGPLDLLGLGIPLATQAELIGSNISQVKQNLANQCGYSNGAIGFIGFNGSFSPGEWQIDSSTLIGLEQKLSSAITNQNANMKPEMTVICINATLKNSNYTIDKTTYISTFTLQVQFVTGDGTLTTHTVTFAVGPNYYRSYTLDGHNI